MYQTLLTQLENGIFTITINRPDKLNALNRDVIKELGQVINEVENNPDIKGVILTGAGQKAFVAGADITEFTGLGVEEGKKLAKTGLDVFFQFENCRKPVIAAVNGFALGGGCELAMACHFRIAAEQAKFGQPEVNLGLIPGYGGTQRLVQLIGKGRAMELLMTGNMIDARTAHQYGLVNHVTSAEELMPKANELMKLIINKAPLAIGYCISAANAAYTSKGYEKELEGFSESFGTEDMKEGTKAFLEKRKPVLKGL